MDFFKIAIVLVSLTGGILSYENSPLSSIAEWKNMDYLFPDSTSRQQAISSGNWIAQNQVLIDVDAYYGTGGRKIFVTIPRFGTGVPITLGTISSSSSSNGPLVAPYPNYSWHSSNGANCDGMTSVFRVAIDQCHRLWVLDSGRVDTTQYCAPQLLVFNLKTDALIRRYRFPATQYIARQSLFVTPIVDVRDPAGTCTDTMVYIADTNGNGIVMYSYKNNTSWRAQNKLVYADPKYGTFNISNQSFDLMDGVLGMSLSLPIGARLASIYSTATIPLYSTDRFLFFHALSAGTQNAVPLRYLDNKALWDASFESVPRAFIEIGSRGVQAGPEAMDCYGNVYFGLMTPNAIGCWDPNQEYSKPYINLIAESDLKLQFASGVKIVTNAGKQELWIATCRLQKVMTGTMNFAEINFRIQNVDVDSFLKSGYRCY